MRYIKLMTILFLITCNGLFAIQDQLGSVEPILEGKETLAKEMTIPALDFEKLWAEESKEQKLTKMTHGVAMQGGKWAQRMLVISPMTQGFVIVNGTLCHVGNYPRSTIFTVLQGPFVGMQTTVAPNGVVLLVNRVCFIDHTPQGVVMRHEYPDSTVLTGRDQAIVLH